LTGPAAEEAFRLYADLLLSDRVCPAPGELGQMRQDIAFLTGRVAMVINGPWLLPLIEDSSLGEAYFVAHIPRGPGGRFTRVTWDGIAINRHAPQERREAAGRFVLFACSKQAQDIFASTRRWIPARVESRLAESPSDESTGADKFSISFDYLRMQPITSHWKQMDRAIQRHLRKLLSGESEARDVLDDLADDAAITEHFLIP
jgi:ABC-type glycerol-3-phosphate transport system substrate-binding protein